MQHSIKTPARGTVEIEVNDNPLADTHYSGSEPWLIAARQFFYRHPWWRFHAGAAHVDEILSMSRQQAFCGVLGRPSPYAVEGHRRVSVVAPTSGWMQFIVSRDWRSGGSIAPPKNDRRRGALDLPSYRPGILLLPRLLDGFTEAPPETREAVCSRLWNWWEASCRTGAIGDTPALTVAQTLIDAGWSAYLAQPA